MTVLGLRVLGGFYDLEALRFDVGLENGIRVRVPLELVRDLVAGRPPLFNSLPADLWAAIAARGLGVDGDRAAGPAPCSPRGPASHRVVAVAGVAVCECGHVGALEG